MQDLEAEARTGEYSTSEVLDVGQTFSNPLDLTKNTLNKGDSTNAHWSAQWIMVKGTMSDCVCVCVCVHVEVMGLQQLETFKHVRGKPNEF